MFRYFEKLVDPYTPYDDQDSPPGTLFAFLNDYLKPLRKVLLAILILTAIVGLIEVGLIYFIGVVVDLLTNTTPDRVFVDHGWKLGILAAFILLVRPFFQVLDAAFLNQSLMPNFGTLIRWRSHRHVLRQSIGWFEND
ncbi:MAG TPA: multidrug ABC transporter ATP-binding protein, partial [Rhodobacteraceae bacterium]|nr:multidrug ABC transporter ATP-binding protein [Paracoccaceae bacterium]